MRPTSWRELFGPCGQPLDNARAPHRLTLFGALVQIPDAPVLGTDDSSSAASSLAGRRLVTRGRTPHEPISGPCPVRNPPLPRDAVGLRLHDRAPLLEQVGARLGGDGRGALDGASANSESSSSTSCWCVQSLELSPEPVARRRDPGVAQRMHHHRVAHHRPRTRAREPGPSDGRAIRRRGSPDHDSIDARYFSNRSLHAYHTSHPSIEGADHVNVPSGRAGLDGRR